MGGPAQRGGCLALDKKIIQGIAARQKEGQIQHRSSNSRISHGQVVLYVKKSLDTWNLLLKIQELP